ncbi:MAG: hypothetical protein OEY43_03220 [Gammaproteobacteria bacterium]|nr:hypothetical protein [Gammaproteobacteria bacterium]
MKKILLSSVFLISLSTASSASAITIDITTQYFGCTTCENWTDAASGTIDSESMGDTFSSNLLGIPWVSTTLVYFDSIGSNNWAGISPTEGSFSYDFTLSETEIAFGTYLTWGASSDVPVLAIFDCGAANIGDACIGRGIPMVVGATISQELWSDGIVVTSAVPVPAAIWLFGSGLIGLLGIGKKNDRT